MVDAIRRNLLVGTGLCAASALTGRGHAHSLEPDAQGPTLSDEGWDADAPLNWSSCLKRVYNFTFRR